MREPKRLAHRQAERNKARALKQWSWDDDSDIDQAEPDYEPVRNVAVLDVQETFLSTLPRTYSF